MLTFSIGEKLHRKIILLLNWRASEASETLSGLFNRESRYIYRRVRLGLSGIVMSRARDNIKDAMKKQIRLIQSVFSHVRPLPFRFLKNSSV